LGVRRIAMCEMFLFITLQDVQDVLYVEMLCFKYATVSIRLQVTRLYSELPLIIAILHYALMNWKIQRTDRHIYLLYYHSHL
jgi:hypothetical protein